MRATKPILAGLLALANREHAAVLAAPAHTGAVDTRAVGSRTDIWKGPICADDHYCTFSKPAYATLPYLPYQPYRQEVTHTLPDGAVLAREAGGGGEGGGQERPEIHVCLVVYALIRCAWTTDSWLSKGCIVKWWEPGHEVRS